MKKYVVGIDLGTTHTVVAYAPLAPGDAGPAAIRLFEIEQLVAPGQVAALPLLPSCRYHPAPGELAPDALRLPWPDDAPPASETTESSEALEPESAAPAPAVIGQLARTLGAQVPGRFVASAKSWLSHAAVDRLAPILPWGAPADVPKVSPVEASASYLRHVRSAWDARFPEAPLARQDLVLTVPASFDEGARALTLAAARQAGLAQLRLLEEPQAVFHDWLLRHAGKVAEELAQTRLVLVCDVGGGTTDLSLIQVVLGEGGQPELNRIGVGNHLMLGGDNMDLALAHVVEARLAGAAGQAPAAPLSASRLSQLTERCRVAKELLLAGDAPAQAPVTLLGGGARLIGGSRSAVLTREEVEHLIVDGFFPQVGLDEKVAQARGGIVAFGLPYARDPAITRHIADFLRQHGGAMPDTLLLNGGVFRGQALARRLQDTLAGWRGAPLRQLHNDNPDVAVARGAVAYALSRQGRGPRIGGGSARSYFLRLGDAKDGASAQGICLLPRGAGAGEEIVLKDRTFALRVGQPVRFQLFSAVADAAGQAPAQAGELVALQPLNDETLVRLPPIVMVLQAAPDAAGGPSAGAAPAGQAPRRRQDIAVQLAAALTEVGTLELYCVSLADASQRWRLEFDLRHADSPAQTDEKPADTGPPAARLGQAIQKIDRIFGTNHQSVTAKEVRQLRAQLEQLLGERERWATPELRQLFDALFQRTRGRRRSAEHERVWLNLAGYCLRPGFGDALDGWRLQQLWPQFEQGVQFSRDKQVCAEWWTLWRRVAGGLDATQQLRLLDDFAFNLQGNRDALEPGAAPPVRGSEQDMLRLGASLERIPADYKAEIGDWLLGRLQAALKKQAAPDSAGDSLALWALGRIGARQPFYGSSHDVVAAEKAADWLHALLALDWKRLDAAGFAAASIARVTDDRVRDVPPALREQVMARLAASHAPPAWAEMVRHRVELDEAAERRVMGESLPPGLKLIH
ncbi:MAG: putative chaperone protein HscA/DnaK [Polaromonas sp.]|nr:putative chaperone protein HscA/DnaK [Polaromonas sp.]